MALILAFPQARPGGGGLRSGCRGEVVIFPGVRIEYHDEERQARDPLRRRPPLDRPAPRGAPLL